MADRGGTAGREPLYAVAMLRVALELKRSPAPPLEEIISRVTARMRLDEPDFRAYLTDNLGLLQPAAPVSRPAPARPRRTPRG